MRLAIGTGVLILVAGCGLVPQIAHQPTYHNPFPQLTKVAVAPFFNLSAEPTVDGRQFAGAYMAELQAIPGFEVAPFPVVEEKIKELGLSLANPIEVRKLAQSLEVDAVVIGAVTDFTPYYPPRCSMQVEWYTANPCFHPIPVGYGLPWGTPEEEYIPDTLVLETELGLAREQLDGATDGVASGERSLRAAQNLDALEIQEIEHVARDRRVVDVVDVDADARLHRRVEVRLPYAADERDECVAECRPRRS